MRLMVRLAVLGAIIVCVTAGVVWVHNRQLGRDEWELLVEARQARDAKHYDQAVRDLRQCIQLNPHTVEAYYDLAELLRTHLGDSADAKAEADLCMKQLVAKNAKSAEAYVLRGRYLKNIGTLDDAQRDAATAMQMDPENADAAMLAAQCSTVKKKYDEARKYGWRSVELGPKWPEPYLKLAEIELQAGRQEEAVSCLQQGIEAIPHNRELLWHLVNLLLDAGKSKDVRQLVQKDLGREENITAIIEARADLTDGQWLSAARRLEKLRAKYDDSSALLLKQFNLWLGACYWYLGNPEESLAAYQRALVLDPACAPARAGSALVLRLEGRLDDAVRELQALVNLPDALPQSWLDLARARIQQNQRGGASSRDWGQVETALAQAEKAMPDAVDVPILRAAALVCRQRLREAEALLATAQNKMPRAIELWIAQAELADEQHQTQRAAEILDEALRQLGDSVNLRLARARYLARHYEESRGGELRQLAKRQSHFSREDRLRLGHGLAPLAAAVGDVEFAGQLNAQLLKETPDDLQVWLAEFNLALAAQDPARAKQILTEIERIEGTGPYWHLTRAAYWRLLLTKENGKRDAMLTWAAQDLAEARRLRPGWPRVLTLSANICELRGDTDGAIDNYVRAIDAGDLDLNVIRRAVQLLYDNRRYLDAERILCRLNELWPQLATEAGDPALVAVASPESPDRALAAARQVVKDSHDYRDQVWLAQILIAMSARAKTKGAAAESEAYHNEAEIALRKGVKLDQTNPAPWAALIQFLAHTGKPEAAEQAIAESRGHIAADRLPLLLAQCYETLGKAAEAAAQYEAAIKASPRDVIPLLCAAAFHLRAAQPNDAEAQLRAIVAGQVPAAADQLAWARHTLADIIAARGGYPNVQKALQLFDTNTAGAPLSVEDLRAKAALLAKLPLRDRRQEAVTLLEGLVSSQQPPVAEDRFALAELCLAQRDYKKAATQLRAVVVATPADRRYLATYVKVLLKMGDLKTAETWLDKLKTTEPNWFPTAELQAELLIQHGQFEQAIALLESLPKRKGLQVSTAEAPRDTVVAILRQFALQLADKDQRAPALQFYRAAEAMLREDVVEQPLKNISLAQVLAAQGRVDDAIALLEKMRSTAEPLAMSTMLNTVASSGALSTAQLQRLEVIATAALDEHPDSAPLLEAAAKIRISQKRYNEAESLLRQCIQHDPNAVSARRHLAYLLARRGSKGPEAMRLVQQAIDLVGPVPFLLDTRAIAYLAQNRFPEALRDLDAAIDGTPDAVYYLHKSEVLLAQDKRDAAGEVLKKAQELVLKPRQLHPLDQISYEKLCAELE